MVPTILWYTVTHHLILFFIIIPWRRNQSTLFTALYLNLKKKPWIQSLSNLPVSKPMPKPESVWLCRPFTEFSEHLSPLSLNAATSLWFFLKVFWLSQNAVVLPIMLKTGPEINFLLGRTVLNLGQAHHSKTNAGQSARPMPQGPHLQAEPLDLNETRRLTTSIAPSTALVAEQEQNSTHCRHASCHRALS